MTREEEIKIAAKERSDWHQTIEEILNNHNSQLYLYDRIYNSEIESFKAGVKWADEYPQSPWISVKDDLPCNHKDLVYHNERCTVEVLVRDKHGNVYTNVMRKGADNIWFFAREQYNIVEFWMRIPELPK